MGFWHPRLASQNLPQLIVGFGAFRLFAQDFPNEGLSLLVVSSLHRLLDVFGRRECKRHRSQEGQRTNEERLKQALQ